MRITDDLTDIAILQALGERAARQRIEAGQTQAELAREAGVSKRTVERIEAGKGCELVMLIRVLRVLKLNEGLNALVPELPPSPMALLKLKGKERRRVAHPRRAAASTSANAPTRRKPWTWGQ
ncbi:MAG: helix-turn-helix domain-containing protein [Gammaproteobacteria bacterium]